MDKLREEVTKWWKDGGSLLGHLLEECRLAQAASDELARECAKLREDLDRQREKNDQLLKERGQIIERIAASLGTAHDALRQLRAAPPDGSVTPATAAAAVLPGAPVPVAEPVVAMPATAAGPVVAVSPDRARILVVDDEENVRTLLALFLTDTEGYEVQSAASGEEALALIGSYQPQAVLLDVTMPGIGGMEALRQIKSTFPGVCVIMISGHEDASTARQALALGAADYLVKPIRQDYLQAVLNLQLTLNEAPPGVTMTVADPGRQVMATTAPAPQPSASPPGTSPFHQVRLR